MLRVQVADMEKTIFPHTEVYKSRLDAGLDIRDLALINITDMAAQTRSFDIKLFQLAVFDNCNTALFPLRYINQHLS